MTALPTTPIDVDEVMQMVERLRAMNRIPIEDAVFVRNGQPIDVPKAMREEFRYTGLAMRDFVELFIFGEHTESNENGEVTKRTPPLLEPRIPITQ